MLKNGEKGQFSYCVSDLKNRFPEENMFFKKKKERKKRVSGFVLRDMAYYFIVKYSIN